MKDLHKNPTFYYILVPVLVGMWPLLGWWMYLPRAKDALKKDVTASKQGQAKALAILALDPERLDTEDPNAKGVDFSYSTAVDKVASLCDMPANKYRLTTGMIVEKDDRKSQTAHLRVNEISIVQLAKFLSLIQLRWGTLQCDTVKLSKVRAAPRPDVWAVDLDFKYYF